MDSGTLFHIMELPLADERLSWGFQLHRNPAVSYDDLIEDVARRKSIRRQINLYLSDNRNFNERLLLNHIIIWYNTFGGEDEATEYLLDELDEMEISCLLPFLDYIMVSCDRTIERDRGIVYKLQQL